MAGSILIKSLADGQLANAKATIYACPLATQAIVRLVEYVNTGAAARTVNLYFKRSGGTSRRIGPKDMSLDPGYAAEFDKIITMEEGDELEGDASVAAEVDFVIKGVEKSAGSGSGALTNIRVSGGTTSNLLSAITFADSNRISFGLNASVMTAKHALNFSGGSTSNEISDQVVFTNANGVTFQLNGSTMSASVKTDYLTTAMLSNAVTLSNINVSAGTTSNLLSAVTFSNSNGVSFGLNAGTITGTVATNYAGQGFTSTTTAGTEVKATLSTNGLSMAVPAFITAGGGGGSINFSAGTTSGNLASVVFSNANNISFGLNAGTITASASGAGTGGGVTISSYQNLPEGAGFTASLHGTNPLSHAVAFQLPQYGSFSFLRLAVNLSQNSTALTTAAASADMSAQRYWTFNAVVYSMGTGASSESLVSVASGSAGSTILNSASIAANGTQGSYTNQITYNYRGGTTSTSSQYSASSTVYPISTNLYSALSQNRMVDIQFANSLTPGPYWLLFGYSSSSATNSARIGAGTFAAVGYSHHYVGSQMNVAWAELGVANSNPAYFGAGSFSTAGGGTTSILPLTNVTSFASQQPAFFQLLRSA